MILKLLILLVSLLLFQESHQYRILQVGVPEAKSSEGFCTKDPKSSETLCEPGRYFNVYEGLPSSSASEYEGFTGYYGDPSTYQRERVNEGAFQTASKELLYGDNVPQQVCPGMVGPFSDGNYYCTAREYGYCDKRSGTCFCNAGYQGLSCTECSPTYFLVGNICLPKKLCPNDCSSAGTCDYSTGTCICYAHRQGADCGDRICKKMFDPNCEACNQKECLRCSDGFYLTGNTSQICDTCTTFDPRCAACTLELKCTTCADPVLTSIRRSGYREQDKELPVEENDREFGITLPFGTKSIESFADAEEFIVADISQDGGDELKSKAKGCNQNVDGNLCNSLTTQTSHRVCGHKGVFKFTYPNYKVPENYSFLPLEVERSGGGYGDVTINYYIRHITTNDSDVAATASYTTSQKLIFRSGVLRQRFEINILDDNLVEGPEVFQVVLEIPEGGGSIGAQFRTNVTIIDDDGNRLNNKITAPRVNRLENKAGKQFSVEIDPKDANGEAMTQTNELFVGILENHFDMWRNHEPGKKAFNDRDFSRGLMHISRPNRGGVEVVYNSANQNYKATGTINQQGVHELRLYYAFPNGLKGQYFSDAYFENLALERMDKTVNFNWEEGRILSRGNDYVSIRWSGAVQADTSGTKYFKVDADDLVRLWIDGELIIDHFHQQKAYYETARPYEVIQGKLYEIVLEYVEITGGAYASLRWGSTATNLTVIPREYLYSLHELKNSPVIISINSADTSAANTECLGEGLYHAVVNERTQFEICPRDQYGNLRDDDDEFYLMSQIFNVSLHHNDDDRSTSYYAPRIKPGLKFNTISKCFDVEYIPLKKGTYELNVKFSPTKGDGFLHVLGSPFTVFIEPDKTSGPHSAITGLDDPGVPNLHNNTTSNVMVTSSTLNLNAGNCKNFTITAYDDRFNLRSVGGDDFDVYMYRVEFYDGQQAANLGPTPAPTSAPDRSLEYDYPVSDAGGYDVVRYGTIYDNKDGTYSAQICPVIAGKYEIHVLLNADGTSNQNYRRLDREFSFSSTLAATDSSSSGQYVASSPYHLDVAANTPNAFTSTATGAGLTNCIVGLRAYYLVTVRDSWNNVCLETTSVTMKLQRTPNSIYRVTDYKNGSYGVHYIANATGINLLEVFVDNIHIDGSPFKLDAVNGEVSEVYSIASGRGLEHGETGQVSYFQVRSYDLSKNRKDYTLDSFSFQVKSNNKESDNSTLKLCPKQKNASHPICDGNDEYGGHFYGSFIPIQNGSVTIHIYVDGKDIKDSPFTAEILSAQPLASYADVDYDIYDQIAGEYGTIKVHLRDAFNNKLNRGGHLLSLDLIGVAVEWGTIEPWGTTPGLPNEYHYKGFHSGYPIVSGSWYDYGNGLYIGTYNVPLSGKYVTKLSVLEPGLNATYFNTTDFGFLTDADYNTDEFIVKHLGRDINLGSTISWTGDIGRRPGSLGDLASGSYVNRFTTRVEDKIDFDFKSSISSYFNEYNSKYDFNDTAIRLENVALVGDRQKYSNNDADGNKKWKFRDEQWSSVWSGLLKPPVAEEFTLHIIMDPTSSVVLSLGELENTVAKQVSSSISSIINSTSTKSSGSYNFTDDTYREFSLKYKHYEGPSFMKLMWESPSTPLQVIPESSFYHWRNISHYNTTIHPTKLSPMHSTAYGDSLNNAVVAKEQSFVVYARDRFGNLRQKGGEVPSMVAVGRDGIAFRGHVTDYGNSTYLIKYYPTVAGDFRMYVTMGCCAPHPNVGFPEEIHQMMESKLLIEGTPFPLKILSAEMMSNRSIAIGAALRSVIAGSENDIDIYFRDAHNNPTSVDMLNFPKIKFYLWDVAKDRNVSLSQEEGGPLSIQIIETNLDKVKIRINMTLAGTYNLNILLNDEHVMGSPFPRVYVHAAKASAQNVVCSGIGIRQGSKNTSYPFKITLKDIYNNPLTVGGSKLYTRLSNADPNGKLVIPTCTDLGNGEYSCQYRALTNGPHDLSIKLLNYDMNVHGGLGLMGHYAFSQDTYMNDTIGNPSIISKVDRVVKFSWPQGDIVNGVLQLKAEESPLAQSIVWDGFLVIPKTSHYQLSTEIRNMNATILIDDRVVYDTTTNFIKTHKMMENSAYSIRIVAVSSSKKREPAGLTLVWSTDTMKKTIIPGAFLYDSAETIQFSPFLVSII